MLLQRMRHDSNDDGGSDSKRSRRCIVAVDLQAQAPLAGVHFLQADITRESTARDVLAALGGERADIVVCDGAADVTSQHDCDQHAQAALTLAALRMATAVLREGVADGIGGAVFIAKVSMTRCWRV